MASPISIDLIELIDSIDLPIVVVGGDTTVTRFNTAAATLLSLSPSDVGRSIRDVRVLAGMVSDLDELCAHVIGGGAAFQREVRPTGASWFLLRIVPYTRSDRQIAGAVLTLTNVTTLRASIELAIQERENAKAIINTVRQPLVVLDAALRVQTANRAFYATFQVSRQETEGVPFYALGKTPGDIAQLRPLLEEVLSANKPVEDFEVELDFPAIGPRAMRFNARRLSRASTLAPLILLAIEDITERKRIETALRDADRRKDEFLAMLSHELRNPLGAITSAVALLGDAGQAHEGSGRARSVIRRQLGRLTRLVDDLLDIARIDAGKIVLEKCPVDLREVAEQALQALGQLGRTREHDISLHGTPAHVEGDPTRLEQVVENLVDNALKYTPSGGKIVVRVEREGEQAVLVVRDSGVGIASDMLSRIFDVFVQADPSADRARGGLGLGLTLVKRLVELHGGTVTASSMGPGQGTEFVMRLPLLLHERGRDESSRPAAASRDPVRSQDGSQVRRVLIIEDNEDAREMLRLGLTLKGHEVHVAVNGPQGVQAALTVKPDVAFIDVGLPGLDGYGVARQLRATDAGRQLYLVALTGYGQAEDRRRALDAGFDSHIVKPVDAERLAEVVRSAPRANMSA